MDEASRCTRVGFMRQGVCVAEGTPEALRRNYSGRVLELVGAPLQQLRRLVEVETGVQNVQMFGDRLHLHVGPEPVDPLITRLVEKITHNGGTVSQLREIPAQLEDVFMALLEGQPVNARGEKL
jgi:ABC-2 type transport system ATP-binding protein